MNETGLDLKKVRENRMILRVLNIGRVEARTCSTWSVGMEDEFVDRSRYRATVMVTH